MLHRQLQPATPRMQDTMMFSAKKLPPISRTPAARKTGQHRRVKWYSALMTMGERRKILQWAEETETYLIEDDYDSELRYYTNPIPAMQSMDAGARTIYTGTFSKSLAPVMRVSYMILPEALQEKYQQRFGRYHAMVSSLHQRALAEFIERGCYEQHINRLRTLYRKRMRRLWER